MSADLAAQLELRALVDRYAIAVDTGNVAELTAMFVEDGGVDVYLAGRPEPVARLRGERQFASMIDALRVYQGTMHFVSNCVLDIDGAAATGTAYCIAHHWYEADGESRDEALLLTYDDRFVLTDDGWRFALRSVHRKWTARQPAGQTPLEVDLALAGRRKRT